MTAGAHAAVTFTAAGLTAPTLGGSDTGNTALGASEYGWTTQTLAQSFTVGSGLKLDSIYIAARDFGNGDSLTLTLTVGSGSTLGSNSLFSQTGFVITGTAATATITQWYKFDFSNENISLATGVNYFSFAETAFTDGVDAGSFVMAPRYSGNTYAGGTALGSLASTNDYTFAVTTVPEPTSALLGGIGLLGLLRRRR